VSKSNEQVLLVPGESGWEIWTRAAEGHFALHSETGLAHAGEITSFPAGELTMLFPVKFVTAVPMRVTSDDESLFPDLAALHAERLGLRPDPMAGQLTDVFVVARERENTALVSVFLRPPADGDLPRRGPKGFDISARAYPPQQAPLVIWKEFGRWVFAVFHEGRLAYCQATSVDAAQPDAALAREIRLSMMQLTMQGLHFDVPRVLVWSSNESLETSAFQSVFKAPVDVALRPAPVLPEPLSKLLPADVRAARRAAQRRRTITLAVSAAALVYLGIIGWFAYGLWQTSTETRELAAQAKAAAPDGEAYADHIARWDELAHAIDLTHAPVDILQRIATCIPPNSGLRLTNAEISAMEVKLAGEAPQLQAVNTFSLNLSKNNGLTHFTWETPEPSQDPTRGWKFNYSGGVPAAESQP
jgi:hypothetical protein